MIRFEMVQRRPLRGRNTKFCAVLQRREYLSHLCIVVCVGTEISLPCFYQRDNYFQLNRVWGDLGRIPLFADFRFMQEEKINCSTKLFSE